VVGTGCFPLLVQGAAQRADTVVAKLVGPVVQVPDTIVTVAPETTIQWLSGVAAVAVAALAVVAIVVEVVRDVRRSREVRDEKKARRTAVDAQISAVAYALRRRLRSWLSLANEDITGMVSIVDTWADVSTKLGNKPTGDVPGVTDGMMGNTVIWASQGLKDHFDWAEDRFIELLAATPDADAVVSSSVRRASVLFYRAAARLRRQLTLWDIAAGGGTDALELSTGYHDLERCIAALLEAVQPDLRQADELPE